MHLQGDVLNHEKADRGEKKKNFSKTTHKLSAITMTPDARVVGQTLNF